MAKQISKEERRNRIASLVKTAIKNPAITSFELRQIARTEWGISERQSYRYLDDVSEMFRAAADKNLKRERGKMLMQLDELYAKAEKAEQYAVCVGIFKIRCSILGLNHLNIHIPDGVEVHMSLKTLKSSWESIDRKKVKGYLREVMKNDIKELN